MTTSDLKTAFECIEIPEQLDLGWIHFQDLKRTVKDHFEMIEREKLRLGKNVEKSALAQASKNHLKNIIKYLGKNLHN